MKRSDERFCNGGESETKQCKKTTRWVFLVILLLICGSVIWRIRQVQRAENYLVKYERFLSYSLGEFEVIIDGELRDAEPVSPKSWLVWELEYMHESGEVFNFFFSDTRHHYGTGFGRTVLHHATAIGLYEITEEVARSYFKDEPLIELTTMIWQNFHGTTGNPNSEIQIIGVMNNDRSHFQDALRVCPYAHVINPRTGLRLYSITAQELVSDWGVSFGISVAVRDYEIYEYMIEQTKAMVRTLAAYLDQDQMEIRFRFRDHDFEQEAPFEDFQLIYHRETDHFEAR